MKRTFKALLLLVSLFVVSVFSAIEMRAQNNPHPELEGIWILEKCEIQKDSTGIISKIDYQLTDGDIPQWYVFSELIFGKEKSCSIKLGEDEIVGEYKQTDDKLILDFVIMIPDYSYSLKNNVLVLKRRYHFQERNTEYFVDIEMSYSKKTEQDGN